MKLFSWKLTMNEWTAAWATWPDGATVMAERFDAVVFSDHKDCPSPDWERGHLFNEAMHVAWRQLGARILVVIAADQLPDEVSGWGQPVERVTSEEVHCHVTSDVALWGKKNFDEPYWIELYIPHVMEAPDLHPVTFDNPSAGEAAKRMLTVESWYERKSGALLYHRYKSIKYVKYKKMDDDTETLTAFNQSFAVTSFELDWWSDAS